MTTPMPTFHLMSDDELKVACEQYEVSEEYKYFRALELKENTTLSVDQLEEMFQRTIQTLRNAETVDNIVEISVQNESGPDYNEGSKMELVATQFDRKRTIAALRIAHRTANLKKQKEQEKASAKQVHQELLRALNEENAKRRAENDGEGFLP